MKASFFIKGHGGGGRLARLKQGMGFCVSAVGALVIGSRHEWYITGKLSTRAARNWTLPTSNHSAEIAINWHMTEGRAKKNRTGLTI